MSKAIAVVGAGPGVGLAVAERFGREGFQVALIARDSDRLNTLAHQLDAKGITAAAFPADVLDRPQLARALQDAGERLGGIDVLEYGPSPGSDSLKTARNIDAGNEQFHLDLAVLGAIAAVGSVLPGLLAQRSGSLLFTTAVSAQHPVNFTASFGVAAGAALNYARLLYQDLKPEGIHAGIVSIAGIVVQPGEDAGSNRGLPSVPVADVAEAHWRHHVERTTPETIVGDAEAIRALVGV